MMRKLNLYTNLMGQVINETSDTLAGISLELAQAHRVALQNRMADDFLLAAQGGVCVLWWGINVALTSLIALI